MTLRNTRKAQDGFTLAELLVSVLIISVVMVVLAPVLTRRATDDFKLAQLRNETRLFLYNKSDIDCTEVSGVENSLDCKFKVPEGVKMINAIIASGGGGGAGATQPTIQYNKKVTTSNATIGSAKSQELKITRGMKNFTVTYLAGGGGGGGGGAYKQYSSAPASQADCDPYQAKYLTSAQNGKGVCVTKYNVGDIPGAANGGIATSVITVSTGTNCSANTCCWRGKTSSSCNSTDTSYSGCNRTMCTWQAVNFSCQLLAYAGTKAGDWRMPTRDELSKWASNITTISRNQGDNGLRLCDVRSGYGSAWCYHNSGVCTGSLDSHCYPGHIWSSSTNGKNYYRRDLYQGSFNETSDDPRYAFSGRCVLDSIAMIYNSFGAGGGGGAPYFKNYQIPDDIITSNVDGKIVMYAAAGGGGGAAATSSGTNASSGSAGGTSYIYVYDKANVLKWGLKVPGGNAGVGAKGASTAAGTGGAQKAINTCQIYNGTSWVATNCTGYGPAGNNGGKITDSTAAANGGAGGGSMYNSSTLTGGGAGGSSSSQSGYNGSLWGAGGGGGTVRFVTSGSTTTAYRGAGGKGANGIVEIKYDLMYQAAGGGGGGGGAFAKIEGIRVSSGTTYTIRVGAGGAGGAISAKGGDGGTSSITFDSVTYSLSGGAGGNVGTSQTASQDVVQGTGGARGIVSTNAADKYKLTHKNGLDGSSAEAITPTVENPYGGSYGGVGGTSGLNTKGGCGGLFVDSSICTNTTVNGTYSIFIAPGDVFDASEYGSAGAGGGGGGWSEDTTLHTSPGYGAQGGNGYVYLYWAEY